MTPALYAITLFAGLVLGWQGSLLVAVKGRGRRRAGQGWGVAQLHTPDAPALDIDLTIQPPYDWRTDPVICGCHLCHGQGRLPTFLGRIERCPCGAQAATRAAAP